MFDGDSIMFNLAFFKGQPTEYIIKYVGGKVRTEGLGLSFYYLKYNTQIVSVPATSMDADFVFNETTNNFQSVTIQGQLAYRLPRPRQAADLLNFTIDPRTHVYLSNDPERLSQRITHVVQMETRTQIQSRTLEETLRDSQTIAAAVRSRIQESALLESMGAELLNLYFVSAKPTPEVAKALEAEYRETLLRKADEAIYARRAAAVEEERKIKENELNTDITLEQQRQQLIALSGTNAQQEAEYRGLALVKEAEYRARASEMELGVYRTGDSATLMAMALREMGQNAEKIGQLTITSEILSSLLNGPADGANGA
jgi:regulator of protease activity HflC (stomatin/prohibitin superfamily)